MNYGLYTAASGALVNMARQDVYSNNLANVTTTGFKPDIFSIRARDTARAEDGLAHFNSNDMLERLGAGVMPMPTRIDLSPGPLEKTGNDLDLGIEGDGFFAVRTGDGSDSLRFSRDGRLSLSADGRLVRAADGAQVLDPSDSPIKLNPRLTVQIDTDGTIRQDGAAVARIALWGVNDPASLLREGNGLLRTEAPITETRREATGTMRQGYTESSGVNPISALMEVTNASRAVDANLRMASIFNTTMDRAINQLGRVT